MIDWGHLFGKLVSAIMSWLDASNLRNRCYKMSEESEIMMTALEDIARMDKGGKMGEYANRAIRLVKELK